MGFHRSHVFGMYDVMVMSLWVAMSSVRLYACMYDVIVRSKWDVFIAMYSLCMYHVMVRVIWDAMVAMSSVCMYVCMYV